MREAERTLEILRNISTNNQEYRFRRLYENLYNQDFYIRAYLKLAPHEGNMTKGSDGKTIDGFSLSNVESIIHRMKLERFKPSPARKEFIPKKNGKLRPLGIGNFEDKLVQEVIREILEAIYEPIFRDSSHGFRPGRSCQTALRRIQCTSAGSSWVIEGDLTNFFGTIEHELLLQILAKRIDDGRLLNLIGKFLKAGYMVEGQFEESILGTPQGSVLSPILANIFLHEFDEFMDSVKYKHDRGKKRRVNPKYKLWDQREYRARKKGDIEYADFCSKEKRKYSNVDPMDRWYCRVNYCRYADDFVIFIAGSKTETVEIRDEIAKFLDGTLHLELNREKTKITNLRKDNAKFLGYEIHRLRLDHKRDRLNRRASNGRLTLYMPKDVVNSKIRLITKNGKPTHRDDLLEFPVEDIIQICNSEIVGLYNYYSYASNVSIEMWRYNWVHIRSMQRTIAKKEKTKVGKLRRKYGIPTPRKDGHGMKLGFGIERGNKPPLLYYDGGFKHKKFPTDLPKETSSEFGKELKYRLLNNTCEVCGSHEDIQVHHVRNLGETIKRYRRKNTVPDWVRLMQNMRRKTLVLCCRCHKALHNGSLKIPEERLGSGLHGNVHDPF